MKKLCKEKLKSLGVDRLADLLFEIADKDEAVEKRLLIATASDVERLAKVRAQISGLKRTKKFYDWRSIRRLSEKIEILIEAIGQLDVPAKKGFQLVVSFYETDNAVFGNCDDSSGIIGDLYKFDAGNLLTQFGSQCDDKPWLAEQVFQLSQTNDYGVRDGILTAACEFLPESETRKLIDRFCELGAELDQRGDAGDQWNRPSRRFWAAAEDLAAGIGDGQLYEMAKKEAWGKADFNAAAWNDIAEVYLKAGDPKTALKKLDNIQSDDHFKSYETEKLRIAIHRELGNKNEVAAILRRKFLRSPSSTTFAEMADVMTKSALKSATKELVAAFNESPELELSFLEFALLELDLGTAERYLFERVEKIDGERYYKLPDLAKEFVAQDSPLAATMILRALSDSILARGVSKNYKIAVGYIRRMEVLAKSVSDWGQFDDHDTYVTGLRENHARKSAFWSKMK